MRRFLFLALGVGFLLPTAAISEEVSLNCSFKWRIDQITNKKIKVSDTSANLAISLDGGLSTIDEGDGIIKKAKTFTTQEKFLLSHIYEGEDKERGFQWEQKYDINRVDGSFLYAKKNLNFTKGSDYFDQTGYDFIKSNSE